MTASTGRSDGVITTEDQLREVLGHPCRGGVAKVLDHIDDHSAGFIANAPIVLISPVDAQGQQDVSPKGDPVGFVHVLDEHMLALPDRPGNHRGDTLSDVLQNPHVALLFLAPGRRETLRVQGATIVRDEALRERMAVDGNPGARPRDRGHRGTPALREMRRALPPLGAGGLAGPEGSPEPCDHLIEQLQIPTTPEKFTANMERDVREALY